MKSGAGSDGPEDLVTDRSVRWLFVMYDSTVDLSGDQTVQALVAVLQLASMVGLALLSVRLCARRIGKQARPGVIPLLVPRRTHSSAIRESDASPHRVLVRADLPARAPPDNESVAPAPWPEGPRFHRIDAAAPDPAPAEPRARK